MKKIALVLLLCFALNANDHKQDNIESLKLRIDFLEKKISDQKTTYDLLLQNQATLLSAQKEVTSQAMTSSASQMSHITWLVGIFGTLIVTISAIFGWYISNGVYRSVDKKLRQEIATGQNESFTAMNQKILEINTKIDEFKAEVGTIEDFNMALHAVM